MMRKRKVRITAFIRSALLVLMVVALPAGSSAQVTVSVTVGGPPALPVYEQPVCPDRRLYMDARLLDLRPRRLLLGARHVGARARNRVCCGLQAIGLGVTAAMSGIRAIGVRMSATTAA